MVILNTFSGGSSLQRTLGGSFSAVPKQIFQSFLRLILQPRISLSTRRAEKTKETSGAGAETGGRKDARMW